MSGSEIGNRKRRMPPMRPAMGVGSQFFEAMGIPILYGRAIDQRENLDGPQPAVVNREFARHFFSRENAVGMTFMGSDGTGGSDRASGVAGGSFYQIVGVCADWHADCCAIRLELPFTAPCRNLRWQAV